MSVSTLLIAAALAVCLAVAVVVMLRSSLRDAAAQADAEAKTLLARANREVKKNPPRASRDLYK